MCILISNESDYFKIGWLPVPTPIQSSAIVFQNRNQELYGLSSLTKFTQPVSGRREPMPLKAHLGAFSYSALVSTCNTATDLFSERGRDLKHLGLFWHHLNLSLSR